MAQRTSCSSEIFLYILFVLLGLILRFAYLGSTPLTEFEAKSAMVAHSLAKGDSADLGDQPAYVLLTAPLFSLLGSSDFVARIWPALFGLTLVALPYFWRDLLGRKVALVLALGLALDPGLVAVSRLASGQMIAISAGLNALTVWRYKQPIVSGIFSAIAIIASPLVFFGLISAFLVWLVVTPRQSLGRDQMRPFFMAAAITLILGGTLFLRVPEGLGAIGNTFASFIVAFTQRGEPIGELGLALVGYAIPAVVFGLAGAVKAWQHSETIGKVASLFALFSLLFVLVYPGRQVADLLWTVAAIWVLAAGFVAKHVSMPSHDLGVVLGEFGLMVLLGIYFGIGLSRLAGSEVGSQVYNGFLWVTALTAALAIAVSILVAFGWSRPAAARGFIWALMFFSAIFLLAAATRFMRVEITDANDLWTPGLAAGSSRQLAASLYGISVLNQGVQSDLSADLRVDNLALAWDLRDLQSSGSDSSIAVTVASEEQPNDLANYRGQSFAVAVGRAWSSWPPNFFAWLMYREAPTQTQQIILWARADMFPDLRAASGQSETNP